MLLLFVYQRVTGDLRYWKSITQIKNCLQISYLLIQSQQEFGNDLTVCVLNILHKTSGLPVLLASNLQTVRWTHVRHFIKRSWLEASYTNSALCPVWCPYTFYRRRYVFYLSSDLSVMLLAAGHHSENFFGQRHSDS